MYLRTAEGAVLAGIQPYTTDADVALVPALLVDAPRLEDAMRSAGFELRRDPDTHAEEPGIWSSAAQGVPGLDIAVDLIVPDGLAPPGGRRGARLAVHGNRAARKIRGLEGCVVDRAPMRIGSLDDEDGRVFEVNVAGHAALLVAKLHKIDDRLGDRTDRLNDKDASDVYRLMSSIAAELLAGSLIRLQEDSRSSTVTSEAIEMLPRIFGTLTAPGVEMATRSLGIAVGESTAATYLTTYTRDLAARLS